MLLRAMCVIDFPEPALPVLVRPANPGPALGTLMVTARNSTTPQHVLRGGARLRISVLLGPHRHGCRYTARSQTRVRTPATSRSWTPVGRASSSRMSVATMSASSSKVVDADGAVELVVRVPMMVISWDDRTEWNNTERARMSADPVVLPDRAPPIPRCAPPDVSTDVADSRHSDDRKMSLNRTAQGMTSGSSRVLWRVSSHAAALAGVVV